MAAHLFDHLDLRVRDISRAKPFYDYSAVFFEGLVGNKWEVCCRNARVREEPTAPAS